MPSVYAPPFLFADGLGLLAVNRETRENSSMVTALIGLGSNLGNSELLLDFAAERLRATPGIRQLVFSSYYETQPIGGPSEQPAFLNAAARLETSLTAESLLTQLQRIETEAGRERVTHWGSRTLDLDLLLYGEESIDSELLTVPHRFMPFRRFVLEPAAEIASELYHPQLKWSIRQLLENCNRLPQRFELWSDSPQLAAQVGTSVVQALPGVMLETYVWPHVSLMEHEAAPLPNGRFVCIPSPSSCESDATAFVEMLVYLDSLPPTPRLTVELSNAELAVREIIGAMAAMQPY